MRRENIQRALEAASEVSNHHEFVIAGSLSVLGLLPAPPERMSMSIDIDFYPLGDPGRASVIAAALGEDSEFHERNGYYLDAVSPALPVLPDGWKDRLVKVELGQATAYFLDVHDTAVSKYARSAENDFRWLEAGYEAKILNIDTIANRVRFSTTYYDNEDQRKTLNGLLMHRIAMQHDGSFAKGLLEYLHNNLPPQNIREVDIDNGEYVGRVLWADMNYAVQSLGRGDIAIHHLPSSKARSVSRDISLALTAEGTATLRYRNGALSFAIKQPEQDRGGPSLG